MKFYWTEYCIIKRYKYELVGREVKIVNIETPIKYAKNNLLVPLVLNFQKFLTLSKIASARFECSEFSSEYWRSHDSNILLISWPKC